MSKNRKPKKQSLTHRQMEQQRKKEFKQKLLLIARASGAEDGFRYITQEDVDAMYALRFRSVRIEPASSDIPSRLLKEIRYMLDKFLADHKFRIIEGGEEVSYKDYLAAGRALVYYLTIGEKGKYPTILHEKFDRLIEAVDEDHKPTDMISYIGGLLCMYISRINRRLYWLDHHMEFKDGLLYDCLYMHTENPEKLNVSVRNGLRTVYRVGWTFTSHGMEWSTVRKGDLCIPTASPDRMLDVYIQSHALIRLKERVDCEASSMLHFHLFWALKELKIEKLGTQSLIEFRLYQKKVGYLVFDLAGNIMVIKTFLFLTMDGTPEGDHLREKLGLQAIDKRYLEIDRLSTFIGSDIKDNQELKEHFEQAGCTDLFKLERQEYNVKKGMKKAGTIASYLKRPEETEASLMLA